MSKKTEVNPFGKCTICGDELNETTALIFSPPIPGEKHETVQRYKLCMLCWTETVGFLKEKKEKHEID